MAYRIGSVSGSERLKVDGLYSHLLDRARRNCSGPDPRVYLSPDGGLTEVRALLANPRRSVRLDKLEAGEPIVVAGWEVGGDRRLHQDAPWLCGQGRAKVRSDDTIEPTDEPWDRIS